MTVTRISTKLGIVLAGLVSATGSAAHAQCEVDAFTQSQPGTEQWHGLDVAISDDVAVALATTGVDLNGDPSIAIVYRRTGTQWMEEAALIVPRGSLSGIEHRPISVDGDVIAAGAPSPPSLPGEAHIFRFDGAQWNLEQTLVGSSSGFFGDAIAASGEIVVVGDWLADGPFLPITGSAFVYRFDAGSGMWLQEQELAPPDIFIADSYGFSISADGDAIIVGAQFHDLAVTNGGAAYVFRNDGLQWNQEAKLVASDVSDNAFFGWDVSLRGDLAIVGAPGGAAAYVFRFNGASWVEETKLTRPAPTASISPFISAFGNAVAIDGDMALVGDPDDATAGTGAGAAHVFKYDGANWVPEATLLAGDAQSGALYGWALAMDGDSAIIGAPAHSDLLFEQGKAYFAGGLSDEDCNGNGEPDTCDIESGASSDANANGIPDECEVPDCNGVPATIYVSNGFVVGGPLDGLPYEGVLLGTGGDDVIVGTDGGDVIVAIDGDDVICGLGGDDELIGGPGFDVIDGGDGFDTCILGDSNTNCELEI